jgi:hypothetical protein
VKEPEDRAEWYRRPVMPFERKAEPLGAWRWSAVGLEFAVSVVLFFLGGRWLDEKLNTRPWLTTAGTMLGVAAGTYLLIRHVLRPTRGHGNGRPTDTREDGRPPAARDDHS